MAKLFFGSVAGQPTTHSQPIIIIIIIIIISLKSGDNSMAFF